MILFWVTLFLFHQGHTLVPVTTVQLGEPATFTCVLPKEISRSQLYWYKQRVGDTLKLIVSLMKNTNPVYGPEFSASRVEVKVDKNISNLTILRTIQKDEGMYLCGVTEWNKVTWSGNYLSLKVIVIFLFQVLMFLLNSDTLAPVKTVQLGESVTFTCVFPDEFSGAKLFWYKQRVGDTLKLIATLMKHSNPAYGPEFSASRVEVKVDKDISTLTILSTIQEDEGMYHCGVTEWSKIIWSGTYLSLKGNTQRTSNYTVVQWPTVSDSVRPGDLMTLQCSVLSDSENKTCPGDHNVYWFKTGFR
ncbi:hypothetical protein L3Q82_020385 [Scortum barcoo]|uniref:Uncharacterized protein n=1 Tax=Scortum barcoo TaxID=214431 RepID=A0ACB8V7U3_9TELE|nr:hypothetical protein L3Q82_020385 [Scortum barcoo]